MIKQFKKHSVPLIDYRRTAVLVLVASSQATPVPEAVAEGEDLEVTPPHKKLLEQLKKLIQQSKKPRVLWRLLKNADQI